VLDRTEVHEARCDARVPRAVQRAVHREHALAQRPGLGPMSLIEVRIAELAQRFGELGGRRVAA
jgi:hypothetical protein